MRQRISLIFYCLASVVIVLHIGSNLMTLGSADHQHTVLHSVTRQTEAQTKIVEQSTAPTVDFQQMAKDLTQEKY
ncbi:hypothetical protein [Photobacterium rosenbergii]|uniref:Methyl-accepting chemotaxis protein n=1 Tax=Photobacterium rosenbergii TaxID=294936 RepID=A0ABU3ZGQ7_9GAMM|nr:hypothetical protein [Photobacterium rosenbergii]MDV5169309.1 hypothetical protein [Photobacterium rosenbergii]